MEQPLTTRERLVADLQQAGAPAFMLRKAQAGEYDDYESPSATPIADLVRDCLATGRPPLRTIAEAAKQGAYDATREEAEAWMAREGRHLLAGSPTPFGNRPVDDPHMAQARDQIQALLRQYDLAGGFYLVNAGEMAYGYEWFTTWNAIVEDRITPLGWRIRARQAELGAERAKALIEGTAHTIGAMKDFGLMCVQWADDLLRMLDQAGLHVEHTPFGGAPLPHLGGLDRREP